MPLNSIPEESEGSYSIEMKKLEAFDALDLQKTEAPTQLINDESMHSLESSLAD